MIDDDYYEQIRSQYAESQQQDQQSLDGVEESDVLEERRIARMTAANIPERWGIRPFARL